MMTSPLYEPWNSSLTSISARPGLFIIALPLPLPRLCLIFACSLLGLCFWLHSYIPQIYIIYIPDRFQLPFAVPRPV